MGQRISTFQNAGWRQHRDGAEISIGAIFQALGAGNQRRKLDRVGVYRHQLRTGPTVKTGENF
jgi:hypothetical protein